MRSRCMYLSIQLASVIGIYICQNNTYCSLKICLDEHPNLTPTLLKGIGWVLMWVMFGNGTRFLIGDVLSERYRVRSHTNWKQHVFWITCWMLKVGSLFLPVEFEETAGVEISMRSRGQFLAARPTMWAVTKTRISVQYSIYDNMNATDCHRLCWIAGSLMQLP